MTLSNSQNIYDNLRTYLTINLETMLVNWGLGADLYAGVFQGIYSHFQLSFFLYRYVN